jgi:prepilin-type N-terminal cleavage/methylation domain-containing protein
MSNILRRRLAKVGRGQAGMSLIELVVVVGIVGVITSMAVVQIANSQAALKGDGGMRVVLSHVNMAREIAISQRRYVQLKFIAPNLLQIIREDTTLATTTLYSVVLEGGVTFTIPTMLPLTATPDAPPSGTDVTDPSGINFPIAAGGNVKFSPDGTLVNQDGVTINGTICMQIPMKVLSVRAVTVLGSTGRVRGFRWNGKLWTRV